MRTRSQLQTGPADERRSPGRPREFHREEALQKAMLVFWKYGYEATSMADIRAVLGITQASLYAAFKSKENLFREAVKLYRRTVGSTTEQALAKPQPARASICAMLQDAVDTFTGKEAPGGCLVVLGAINCSTQNRGIQADLTALRRETQHQVLMRLKRGQREGDVAADAPVSALASFYTTVLHGLSIQARDGATRKDLTHVVERAMSAWYETANHSNAAGETLGTR